MHIAISGNIGSGKTTLAGLLAKEFGWKAMHEPLDDNPYIANFYEDMHRWSFNLQIYLLYKRFNFLIEEKRQSKDIVQDRTLFEDAYIFAPNLHAMGLMATKDYETYLQLFQLLDSFISPPDLLIYLKASTESLLRNIQNRGREYESNIRFDYIASLNHRYDKWIEGYDRGRLLVVEVDDLDFSNNEADLNSLFENIRLEINQIENRN